MYVMLLIRALVVGLIFYAFWLLLFTEKPQPKDRSTKEESKSKKDSSHQTNCEKESVTCHYCGAPLSPTHAIRYQDRYYCSKAHFDQDHPTS